MRLSYSAFDSLQKFGPDYKSLVKAFRGGGLGPRLILLRLLVDFVREIGLSVKQPILPVRGTPVFKKGRSWYALDG